MRVLVIEDDASVADYIVKGLKESGYNVDYAADGKVGLVKATTENYDVAIVDRMLPHVDGLTIVQTLRASNNTTPVLILSALGDVDDRVKGLKAGGDDYLVKPFAFAELLARIEAVLRRQESTATQTRLKVGDLEMDLLAHKVTRAGEVFNLQPRGIQASRIPDASCRSGGYPHDAAGKCLGLSLRSANQRDRRAYQPPASEDRQRLRQAVTDLCAWRRVYAG